MREPTSGFYTPWLATRFKEKCLSDTPYACGGVVDLRNGNSINVGKVYNTGATAMIWPDLKYNKATGEEN